MSEIMKQITINKPALIRSTGETGIVCGADWINQKVWLTVAVGTGSTKQLEVEWADVAQ